jgi:alkanesulfonate monooxygenase SsuD/methylene tetrahydromethanopterin reductase-like flavin-dependent oxidoreductase (luciferase family)
MRVLLAAAAALTERIRIVPSLYVLPMHSAVWAAKEIATLDVLSEGRVTLTVGVGGRENDYRAVGASFARRHQRMDEQIAEMRRIWQGEAPFEGADEVGPRPVQPGGPPILAGAMGPKAIRRAAEWGEGIYAFSMNGDAEAIQGMLDAADQAWSEAGREVAPRRVGGFWYSLAPNAEAELKSYVFDYMQVFGDGPANAIAKTMTRHTPDSIQAALDDLEALECDEVYLVSATADLREIDGIEELIAKRS